MKRWLGLAALSAALLPSTCTFRSSILSCLVGAAAEKGLKGRIDVADRPGSVRGVEDCDGEAAGAERRARHGGVTEKTRQGRRVLAPAGIAEAHRTLLPRSAVADKCQRAATSATGSARALADSE